MDAPILWHGSPRRFETFGRREQGVRLGGYWTAADPLVAAVYAGAEGVIYPVVPAPGIRILDASGIDGVTDLHYMSEEDISLVLDAAERLGFAEGLNDPPGSGAAHFDHARDESCWEGLLCEGIPPEGLGQLLQECGWDAVLAHDSTGGVAGDYRARAARGFRRQRILVNFEDLDTRLGPGELRVHALAKHLENPESDTPVLAFLSPASALVQCAGAIPAIDVVEAWEQGRELPVQPCLDVLRGMAESRLLDISAPGMRR